jgi:hypothetical protein
MTPRINCRDLKRQMKEMSLKYRNFNIFFYWPRQFSGELIIQATIHDIGPELEDSGLGTRITYREYCQNPDAAMSKITKYFETPR